jgi:N-acetylmuramoyl-L-alanine amidase
MPKTLHTTRKPEGLQPRRYIPLFAAIGALALGVGATSASASPGADASYVVSSGDTLSAIAQAQQVSLAELVALNGLDDPHHIVIGQRLRLPDARAAATSAAPSSPAPGATRTEAGALIDRVAREHGWDPAIVKALAWQESGWNQSRVSPAGAVGIMQVMPATGQDIAGWLGRDLDLHDPEDNVIAGVTYLQWLWERTDGDLEATLAGYYQGLRSVEVNGRYQGTERYIANVLALRERFR